jgi:hypothetical protein
VRSSHACTSAGRLAHIRPPRAQVHPDGYTGHRVLAELAYHLLLKTLNDVKDRPLGGEEKLALEAPLVEPMLPGGLPGPLAASPPGWRAGLWRMAPAAAFCPRPAGNHEPAEGKCYLPTTFRSIVTHADPAWTWVDEVRAPRLHAPARAASPLQASASNQQSKKQVWGSRQPNNCSHNSPPPTQGHEYQPKWGYVSSTPGSRLVIQVGRSLLAAGCWLQAAGGQEAAPLQTRSGSHQQAPAASSPAARAPGCWCGKQSAAAPPAAAPQVNTLASAAGPSGEAEPVVAQLAYLKSYSGMGRAQVRAAALLAAFAGRAEGECALWRPPEL